MYILNQFCIKVYDNWFWFDFKGALKVIDWALPQGLAFMQQVYYLTNTLKGWGHEKTPGMVFFLLIFIRGFSQTVGAEIWSILFDL